MKKTIIALMALAGVASAASVGYSSMDSTLSGGVVLGLDWDGGASKSGVTGGTVQDGTLIAGGSNGGPWVKVNAGKNFTLSFDISNVSANAWNSILSVADSGWVHSNDGGRLQLQANNSGDLYLYNTSNADPNTGAPIAGTPYYGGFLVGSENMPSDTSINLGISKADTQNKAYTLTFVSDATAGTFTAYCDGVQVGQWTGWTPANDMDGFQFAKRFGDDGRAVVQSVTIDNLTLWNRALSATEVGSLIVPEPTTATLSLLALAGLAARRRRK